MIRISNRVFWGGVLIACSCILAPPGLSSQRGTVLSADVIDTRRLRILDAAGKVRAEIGTRADGTPYSVGITEEIAQEIALLRLAGRTLSPGAAPVPNVPAAPAPGTSKAVTHADVYSMVQQLVRTQLKTPDAARFAPLSDVRINETHAGVRYIVNGWVDSGNDFGGTVRLYFRAVVRRPYGAPWTLDEYVIEQLR